MWYLLLALADEAGHAAGGEHAAPASSNPLNFEWLPAATTLIVFGVAFFVLARVVWPKITAGLDERDRKIRDEIRSAEEAREQAKAALSEYEESLRSARAEAASMIAKAKADAKATGEELRARNEAQLTEMKDRATRDIEAAKQAAVLALHAEAASLATAVASKILQREVTAADQQRLIDESLRELSSRN
ncbi:MAG: F0F1 ATP synthase subunit B [Phycisphaerales bacterium]|nr:F0F1 ATP synthase subunit B [Phycisphaerales bacterium]